MSPFPLARCCDTLSEMHYGRNWLREPRIGNGQASQAGFVVTRCCGGAKFHSVMIGGWNE